MLDKIKDALSSKFAELLVGTAMAVISAVSLFTVRQFWDIYDHDPTAVSMLAASFFALGFVAGFLARLACERLLPNGRTRSLIRRLPRDQKAVLGIALGADGVVSVADHIDDVDVLAGDGLVSIASKGFSSRSYTTTDVVRRSVSRDMREELRKLGDAMLEADRSERISLLASGIARYDIVDRELLAELVSAGSRGVDVHSSCYHAPNGVKEKDRALESLALQKLCDFETISDGKRWFPTDLLLEVAERHPGLFTEL